VSRTFRRESNIISPVNIFSQRRQQKGEKYLRVTWPNYAGRTTRDDLFVDCVGFGVADLLVELVADPGIKMGLGQVPSLGHNKLPTFSLGQEAL
jgi:hypothetical protein